MKTSIKCYIISVCSTLVTIFLFADHKYLCKYDMNLLCFIGCAWPIIFSIMFFMFGKAYQEQEKNDEE